MHVWLSDEIIYGKESRVLRIDDFNMTSGIGFVYLAGLEGYLLTEYKKLKEDKTA